MTELANSSSPFSDLGFQDPIEATRVFSMMNLKPEDLNDPAKRAKLSHIAEFFRMAPDALELSKRVVMKNFNPHVSLIDKLWEYSSLQKERIGLRSKLSELENKIAIFE